MANAWVGVRALKEKRLELPTPNLVQSMAAVSRAKKMRSKGQRSRSRGDHIGLCEVGVGLQVDMTA